MFKRMHVLGSRAKFIAVSWYGYQSQNQNRWGWTCLDYQTNVINAFATAQAFAGYAASIPKQRKIVGAHSLGNLVVSAAIQDWGFTPDEYFMFNAAVSSEAYSQVGERWAAREMIHRDWGHSAEAGIGVNLYPEDTAERERYEHLFAFNWYRRFDPDADSRASLKWNGRFHNAAAKATHFWSKGDQTFHPHQHLADPDSLVANLEFTFSGGFRAPSAWSVQEKIKGRELLPLVSIPGVHEIGGWGMNPYYQVNYINTINHSIHTFGGPAAWAEDPGAIPQDPAAVLIERPYFRIGEAPAGHHDRYTDLFDPAKPNSASDYLFNATLLATFIPSKQLAAGGRGDVPGFQSTGDNKTSFEMQEEFDNGGWYDENKYTETDPEGGKEYWDHGDFKKIAMPYVWKLYDKFIQIGELNHE